MYNNVNIIKKIVNSTVLYTWNSLRVDLKCPKHTHTQTTKQQISLNLSTMVPTEWTSFPMSFCAQYKDGGMGRGVGGWKTMYDWTHSLVDWEKSMKMKETMHF